MRDFVCLGVGVVCECVCVCVCVCECMCVWCAIARARNDLEARPEGRRVGALLVEAEGRGGGMRGEVGRCWLKLRGGGMRGEVHEGVIGDVQVKGGDGDHGDGDSQGPSRS